MGRFGDHDLVSEQRPEKHAEEAEERRGRPPSEAVDVPPPVREHEDVGDQARHAVLAPQRPMILLHHRDDLLAEQDLHALRDVPGCAGGKERGAELRRKLLPGDHVSHGGFQGLDSFVLCRHAHPSTGDAAGVQDALLRQPAFDQLPPLALRQILSVVGAKLLMGVSPFEAKPCRDLWSCPTTTLTC
jgi:hypothetical protein